MRSRGIHTHGSSISTLKPNQSLELQPPTSQGPDPTDGLPSICQQLDRVPRTYRTLQRPNLRSFQR